MEGHILFYNAGDKIEEVLLYSVPTGHDIHCTSRWTLTAPREDFFEVPTHMELQTGETISVQFAQDIFRKFGYRGVVRIDAHYKPENEDPDKPVVAKAANRQAAIARGNELWEAYLKTVVESHLRDCESARVSGGAPRSASGFTKRAMKLLNVQDPGEQYFKSLQHGGAGETPKQDGTLAALQAQMNVFTQLLMAVAAGKAIDPTQLAAVATPAVGVSSDGAPVTSGIATGEIRKPLGETGSYTTAHSAGRTKSDRAKEAAKEL